MNKDKMISLFFLTLALSLLLNSIQLMRVGNKIDKQRVINIMTYQQVDSLKHLIQERYVIDSLYHNHMSQCAYELRPGINPDKFN